MAPTDPDKSIIRESSYLMVLLSALTAAAVAGVCLLLMGSIPAREGFNIAKIAAAFFSLIGVALSVVAMGLSYSWLTLVVALLTMYANITVQSMAFG